ncbi:hypothetical protein, partial [Vibrio mediterranei]|uniref:hypothetical protein n=1 Tax=Vibrio mediterranei TaxID=689 RepID=UPI001C0FBC6D
YNGRKNKGCVEPLTGEVYLKSGKSVKKRPKVTNRRTIWKNSESSVRPSSKMNGNFYTHPNIQIPYL